MADSAMFIFYLLTFRLAVIACGVVAIVLGYRLFIHGTRAAGRRPGDEEMTLKAGEVEFSMRNTAPGTGFALFGAALIVAMLIKAPPEITQSPGGSTYRAVLPLGTGEHPVSAHSPDEVTGYWRDNADSLNNTAWQLLEQKRQLELADALVRVAIAAAGDSQNMAQYLDTRDRIHEALSVQGR